MPCLRHKRIELGVKKSLSRLKKFVPGPLWTESDSYRARRRCRTLFAAPFAALGGLAWGVFSAEAIGIGSQLLWGGLGAFAFGFLIYLELLLVPPLATLASRVWAGSELIAVLLWEVAVVGGLVFLLTRVLGAPLIPAAGTALGFGAAYTLLMEYLVCGSAAADITSLLQATGGGGKLRPEDHSRAQALVHRGQFDEAIEIYETAITQQPYAGASYVGLARALTVRGAYDEAVTALRRGLVKADLSHDQEAFLVRQIHELCSTKLGDPAEAVEDLRALLAHQPEGLNADWATQELNEIEAGGAADPNPDDQGSPRILSAGDVERFDPSPTPEAEPGTPDGLGVDRLSRLRVEEDFHVSDHYDLGDGLILEDGLTMHELFAEVWDSGSDPAGAAGPEASRDATEAEAGDSEGDPDERHREEDT